MVNVTCSCGQEAEFMGEDSRQEWYEGYYECSCGNSFIHRREFDQSGLVTRDEVIELTKINDGGGVVD